jgi:hypothetical protein
LKLPNEADYTVESPVSVEEMFKFSPFVKLQFAPIEKRLSKKQALDVLGRIDKITDTLLRIMKF